MFAALHKLHLQQASRLGGSVVLALKMKILVYGINFTPEPTGAGKYTGEMVESLVAAGHDVRVVTAQPYYPAWRISAPYANKFSTERLYGARVWRAPLWVPLEPTGLTRIIHLMTFAMTSFPLLMRQLFWRPNVVFMVAPAFACAPGAWLTARLCGAKAWIHVQDFEVDAAFRLGLLKGKFIKWLIRGIEQFIFKRFDRVSSISLRMLERVLVKGIPRERVVSFVNWVDIKAITPLKGVSPYRAELNIPDDHKVVLFSGTLAGKQGLDLLPQVARLLHEWNAKVIVVICGDGQMKNDLLEASVGLPNMRYLHLQPYERLSELLGMADAQLLPQNPGAADLVMPSKLTGMMASGRPIVCTADEDTELERVVSHCGVVVKPGNATKLALAIKTLLADPAQCEALGKKARAYAEQYLSREGVMLHFERTLEQCMNPASQPLLDPMNP